MKIYLKNQQTKHILNLENLQKLSEWISLKINNHNSWKEITILLTDDEGIHYFHKKFLNNDNATDVISFRHEPIPGEENKLTGDLVVNVERAHQEGLCRNNPDFEIAFYIAHGFDHLNGATDDTAEERLSMHMREEKWLNNAKKINLLNNLFL